jgi:hypothetical protein
MPIQIIDDGSGTGSGTNAPDATAGLHVLKGNPDLLLSAVVLALLDELNTVRAALVPPLTAKTATQIITAIQAKVT